MLIEKIDLSGMIDKIINKIFEFCAIYGLRLIIAVVVLIIGFKVVNLFGKRFKKMKVYEKLDPTMRTFLRSCLTIGLKLALVVAAALIVGIPVASLVAVIGSAGLAIGLALQGSLSNIAGGFIILVFKPFKVGDFIATVDATGTVEAINLFYTKVITTDNKVIMVPNSIISNQSLTDYSSKSQRRVDFVFSTSYETDFEKVKAILLEIGENHPLAFKDPAPEARLNEYAASSMNFTLRVWCKTDDYWTVYFEIMESVKKAFDENGIEIPYQQLDVHINNK